MEALVERPRTWNLLANLEFLGVSGGFLGGSCRPKKSRKSAEIGSKSSRKSEIFGVWKGSGERLGGLLGPLGTSWEDLGEEV